jgi:hypothetical protein
MKANFLVLALANLLLMATTTVTGLAVDGSAGYERHFYLGVLTALYTCFVHVVAFMYFVVQQKIVDQAARTEGLAGRYFELAGGFKMKALRLSAVGMATIILAGVLGGAIESGLPASVHFVAGFAAFGIHLVLFARQFSLIAEYRAVFREAFNE